MSTELAWFKSSYSDDQGGACLEVSYAWRKSSYSNTEGGECIEVALCPHAVHVRDSKLGDRSPQFGVAAGAWGAFVAYARGV